MPREAPATVPAASFSKKGVRKSTVSNPSRNMTMNEKEVRARVAPRVVMSFTLLSSSLLSFFPFVAIQ